MLFGFNSDFPYVLLNTEKTRKCSLFSLNERRKFGTATILFEASGADEIYLDIEDSFNVTTEISRLEGDSWKLELSEARGMEKGKKLEIFVEGSAEWDVTVNAEDQSWCEVNITSCNHFFLDILPNNTSSTRELTITVADKAGVFSYSCVYGQDRGDETHEEIIAREKAAIIALCEAFGLEYDTNFEMQGNGYL